MPWLYLLAGFLAGGGCVFLAAKLRHVVWGPGWSFKVMRAATIRRHAAQIEPGQAILIGDSTAEGQGIAMIGGLRVLNAGVNGALIREVIPIAREALATSRPALAIFTVGLNNLQIEPGVSRERRECEFQDLFDLWPGAPVILGLTPILNVAPALIEETNAFLAAQAVARGGSYVEPIGLDLTEDGIHAGPEGALVWRERVEEACRRLIARTC